MLGLGFQFQVCYYAFRVVWLGAWECRPDYASGLPLLSVKQLGVTLGDIAPLNQVPLQRATSRIQSQGLRTRVSALMLTIDREAQQKDVSAAGPSVARATESQSCKQ